MIPKNLLTIKQIQKAAKTSDMAALKCSLKHWRQIEGLTESEREELYDLGKLTCGESYCACCERWLDVLGGDCVNCPLYRESVSRCWCCGGLYDDFYFRVVANDGELALKAHAVADYIAKVIKNYKKKK